MFKEHLQKARAAVCSFLNPRAADELAINLQLIKNKWLEAQMPDYLYQKSSYLVKLDLPTNRELYCILIPDSGLTGYGDLEILFDVPLYNELRKYSDWNHLNSSENDIEVIKNSLKDQTDFEVMVRNDKSYKKLVISRNHHRIKPYIPEIPQDEKPYSAEIFLNTLKTCIKDNEIVLKPVSPYTLVFGN